MVEAQEEVGTQLSSDKGVEGVVGMDMAVVDNKKD